MPHDLLWRELADFAYGTGRDDIRGANPQVLHVITIPRQVMRTSVSSW